MAFKDQGITEHVLGDPYHIVFLPRKVVKGFYWIEIILYTEDAFGKEEMSWKVDWVKPPLTNRGKTGVYALWNIY